MANPSRQKGTAWETALLEPLRLLFGRTVERSSLSGINDSGDFYNVPWLHEAKSTQKPMFQQWARKCEQKAGRAWCIIWKGDTRKTSGVGPYVLMPLALYERLADGVPIEVESGALLPGCLDDLFDGTEPHLGQRWELPSVVSQ